VVSLCKANVKTEVVFEYVPALADGKKGTAEAKPVENDEKPSRDGNTGEERD
jgi:hypothetical protein